LCVSICPWKPHSNHPGMRIFTESEAKNLMGRIIVEKLS